MKNWIIFLTLLTSVSNAAACTWWPEGDEIRFSLFASNLGEGDDISPLFYSPHYFNNYKVDEYTGPTENLNEWFKYFDSKYDLEPLDELIYGGVKANLDDNLLWLDIKAGYKPEASIYIIVAKGIEEKLRVDYWDDKKMELDELEKVLPDLHDLMVKTNDQYLKLRYAYQMVVINYYLGNYAAVQKYHESHVMTSTQESVIKYWSMLYYANTMSDQNDRLYLLSRVFDNCRSKAKYIYQAFPSSKDQVKGVLDRCKSKEEMATVLSIVAFKNPGRALDQIKEIANLDPSSELLDILLIREINKMEDWYLSDHYIGYGSGISTNCWECEKFEFIREKNFQSDKKYLKKMLATTEGLAMSEGVRNRGLWFTSLAYMSYMLDDEAKTAEYVRLAKKHTDSREIYGQLKTIDILRLVKFEKEWNKSFQKELFAELKEFELYSDVVYQYDRFKSQIMLAISKKFMDEGDLVLAALFESKVKGGVINQYGWGSKDYSGYQAFDLLNENASSSDMDKLFELWEKSDKTPLEEELFTDLEPYKWRLTDLWATQYFREDDLIKALEIYESIPDSVWHVDNWELHYYYDQELDNDPFETNMFGRSYGANKGSTYTKPEFIREIIRLRTLLDGPMVQQKARYALLLGNAYYNMTHNGNSYYYTEYSWSSWEGEYPRNQDYYYNSSRALKYYEMAENFAPNDAYAAFCHRLKLKCIKDAVYYSQKDVSYDKRNYAPLEEAWDTFNSLYPKHADKLRTCDHFIYYSNSWQEG